MRNGIGLRFCVEIFHDGGTQRAEEMSEANLLNFSTRTQLQKRKRIGQSKTKQNGFQRYVRNAL